MALPLYFSSDDAGAPTLNNAAGSLIAVIKACVQTGFNTKSVTSMVVASGVATVTANGHGFVAAVAKDVQIDGCAEAALNGRKALTFADTNTVKFAAPGVADGTYGGTMTIKRAALGWVEQFAGTNVSIFKRTAAGATAQMLRVLDTAAAPATTTEARCFMVESATDVNTYTGQGPTQAQLADGQYIYKGANSATAKKWVLIGDDQFFYLFTDTGTASGYYLPTWFGDPISYKAGDAYHTLMGGQVAGGASPTYKPSDMWPVGGMSSQPALAVARLNTQTGAAVIAVTAGLVSGAGQTTPAGSAFPVSPDPIGNGCVVSRPVFFAEANTTFRNPIRGHMPGLAQALATTPYAEKEIVTGLGDGHTYVAIPLVAAGTGQMLIDISHAWR